MICPKCNCENSDNAKFCKKCGTPLKSKVINHEKMINSMDNANNSNNTTKIIIVSLIVIAVVLAGAFIYINSFSNDDTTSIEMPASVNEDSEEVSNDDEVQQSAPQTTTTTQTPTAMYISGGSFSTGSGLSDKTYAKIFVGSEHAGEKVKIQIYYSRDGNDLNNGNIVPKTVNSEGYIEVASAEPYKYYPDFATINLYDTSGNLLDTQSVSLSTTSGTQYF